MLSHEAFEGLWLAGVCSCVEWIIGQGMGWLACQSMFVTAAPSTQHCNPLNIPTEPHVIDAAAAGARLSGVLQRCLASSRTL